MDGGPEVGQGRELVCLPPPSANSPPCSAISFEDLYRVWRGQVERWVRAFGARQADNDDLVQEIFLVASRGLGTFDGRNPGGWLYNIAWRKVRDYRKIMWNGRYFGSKSVDVDDELLTNPSHPLSEFELNKAVTLVDRVLASLNVEYRVTFLLFAVEGQTGDEIAQLHNVPINTVWARLHRTRLELVRCLQHSDEWPLVSATR